MSTATVKTVPLRIGLLQFTPKHSDPRTSSEKVTSLCAKLSSESIDILVAPEMCLTGYIFKGVDDIKGLCEDVCDPQSPTVNLATSLSKRLECHTLMGFPEHSTGTTSSTASQPFDARPQSDRQPVPPTGYFNSALLTSPTGSTLHTFRKHFLFTDDERWSSAGAGFQFIDVSIRGSTVRIAVGICMDLNPYAFRTEFEKYEFTTWCKRNNVGLVLVPMAWLAGGEGTDNEPDWDVVDYWAARCAPFWEGTDCVFVACNRTGVEGETTFAGSSTIISFRCGRKPQVIAAMGRREEALVVESVDVPVRSGDDDVD